ncbi:tail completion protein gp17 [Sphingomonas sp. CLY1604]|uniref:tail completion protein gp17 n=1 Tax=Sphingomonas sp. CLY1604 TaxID=3457786 RepID=UPI003FD8382C
MSAGTVLHAAVVQRLGGIGRVFDAPPARVFDAPPARAAPPFVVVDDPILAAGDAAGVAGRTGTVAVACIDTGLSPVRVRALLARVEAALADMPADLGGGWRVTALRLARSQVAQGRGERWVASSVFAVRMYRIN